MSLALADSLLALAARVGSGPIVYLAASEQGAERLARLASLAFPHATILFCPATDAIAGEAMPPSAANAGARVSALHALAAGTAENPVLIASAEASVHRYAPPSRFKLKAPEISVGATIDLQELQRQLIDIGYRLDERIDEPGEVGTPGAVLDVYPVDAERPVRIEVDDRVIRSLRLYDPVSQRSEGEIQRLSLGRAAEPDVGAKGVSLLAHVPDGVLIIDPDVADRRQRTIKLFASVTGKRKLDAARTVDTSTWEQELAARAVIVPDAHAATPRFIIDRRPDRAFARFLEEQSAAGRSVLVAGSDRDARFLARRFSRQLKREAPIYADLQTALKSRDALSLVSVPLDAGAITDEVAVVAAADLIGGRADRDDRLALPTTGDQLTIELRIGDAVVHEDHGVAILRGLTPTESPNGNLGETIELEYAKSGIRQVPLGDAAKLWRYGGEPDAVRLDTLDGKSWEKRRPAIEAAIAATARAIRALAREKAVAEAPVLEAPTAELELFGQGFPFQETADQWKAIEAVRSDLLAGKPMDRLVVGDVGFGKTEVALRAAAQAALAGKQVALVAPTTLLARQHFDTFVKRFEPLGIEIGMLSRLGSSAATNATKAALADGSLRVVVGTSALTSKTVCFADLALVIIDEEQRFGAAQKEKLSAMGAGHTLRLSATPIPRTLQSALVGLNDLSIIATPPARRVPIRTTVCEFDEATVRAALLREHGRSGQSFVVIPRIEDVEATQAMLARLVPELSVVTVHGKMTGDAAEVALVDFARGEGDVLLATSIIETGLDVPRANTMIVLDAHLFGIGQLHQLRGRVGRSSRHATVLLTTAAGKALPDRTRTRLMHLAAQDSLGAGFAVSAHDLDLRGAGDLLSEDQSGHMKLVGIELYQHLLGNVLRELAGEVPEAPLPPIQGGVSGVFPADWIVEADARIAAYVRLARCSTADDIDQLIDELEDRYGALPDAALALVDDRRLALTARALGLERVQIGPSGIALTPGKGAKLPPEAPLEPKGDRWLLKFDTVSNAEARQKAAELLEALI